jgi:hypothetical protein
MHQEKGFKFCLDTRDNEALPLDLAYLECLSVQWEVDLPHWMLNIWRSSHVWSGVAQVSLPYLH